MTPNNKKLEKEQQQNETAIIFVAGTTLVSTGAAMVDIALPGILPAQATVFIAALMCVGALGMVLCFLDHLSIKAKMNAPETVETLATAEEPVAITA